MQRNQARLRTQFDKDGPNAKAETVVDVEGAGLESSGGKESLCSGEEAKYAALGFVDAHFAMARSAVTEFPRSPRRISFAVVGMSSTPQRRT